MKTKDVKFSNPPISEVIHGVYFKTIEGYQSIHTGAIWQSFRDEYPHTEDRETTIPSEKLLGSGAHFTTMPPIRRTWFKTKGDCNIIQVQENAFICNWRKRGDNVYPGFLENNKRFFSSFSKYTDSLRSNDLPDVEVDGLELTYSNQLQKGIDWDDYEDLEVILPKYTFLSAEMDGFQLHTQHRASNNIRLITKIVETEIKNSRAIVIELSARTFSTELDRQKIEEWFTDAHKLIIERFIQITSENHRKNKWKQNAA